MANSRITFLEPLEHTARFVISGEARLPRDGVIEIPYCVF